MSKVYNSLVQFVANIAYYLQHHKVIKYVSFFAIIEFIFSSITLSMTAHANTFSPIPVLWYNWKPTSNFFTNLLYFNGSVLCDLALTILGMALLFGIGAAIGLIVSAIVNFSKDVKHCNPQKRNI